MQSFQVDILATKSALVSADTDILRVSMHRFFQEVFSPSMGIPHAGFTVKMAILQKCILSRPTTIGKCYRVPLCPVFNREKL